MDDMVWSPHTPPDFQESVNAHFHARAEHWREVYYADGLNATIYRERKAAVLRLAAGLELPLESRILEVGCGAGPVTVELARRGFQVHALDAVRAMIDRTLRAAAEAGVLNHIRPHLADVRALGFADATFSLVLAVGVLPWMDSLSPALTEMARVTRPGGHLILTIDNAWRLNHLLDPRCFPTFRPIRRKVRDALERAGLLNSPPESLRPMFYSIRQFDTAMLAAGLRKVAGETLGFGPFTFLGCRLFTDRMGVRIQRKLQRWADRGQSPFRSTGVEYVVLCQKSRA